MAEAAPFMTEPGQSPTKSKKADGESAGNAS